jgi:outer membrane lipoprotein-sorting protein
MNRRVAFLWCATAALSGCFCEPPPPPSEGGAAATSDAIAVRAIDVLAKRLASIKDLAVEGTVLDQENGERLAFRYAMAQPNLMVGELLDPNSGSRRRAFVFDGKALAVIDDEKKQIARRDLSETPEQGLLTLHEIFSQFVCEGWRPPLVKAQGVVGAVQGDAWTLTIPIVDEVLHSQRLVLRTDGSFVKKELLDDQGRVVAATAVLEDWKDPETMLVFPQRWQYSERGTTQVVSLTSMAVNAGVDPTRFATSLPPGYADASR